MCVTLRVYARLFVELVGEAAPRTHLFAVNFTHLLLPERELAPSTLLAAFGPFRMRRPRSRKVTLERRFECERGEIAGFPTASEGSAVVVLPYQEVEEELKSR